MKIQLLSDTHNRGFEINEDVDFAIHAGDITNYGVRQRDWQGNRAYQSMGNTHVPIYWVPGNHDIGFNEDTNPFESSLCVNLLNNSIKTTSGISIAGVSLSVCYNLPELRFQWDHMTANHSIERAYYESILNKYYDIIVSHSPPSGITGTETMCGDIGSNELRKYILKHQPRLVVCGHVHRPLSRTEKIGRTWVINVAEKVEVLDWSRFL